MRVNPGYKMNRPKLLRDIRVLRQFFGGKISDETTNDPEQLRIKLSKCKSSLENDVGDVGVVGIEECEKRQATSSGVNLNVHMNVTPVKNKMKYSKINVRNNLEVGTDAGNVNDTRKAKRSKGKKKQKAKSKRSVTYNNGTAIDIDHSLSSSSSSSDEASEVTYNTKNDHRRSRRRKKQLQYPSTYGYEFPQSSNEYFTTMPEYVQHQTTHAYDYSTRPFYDSNYGFPMNMQTPVYPINTRNFETQLLPTSQRPHIHESFLPHSGSVAQPSNVVFLFTVMNIDIA